MKMASQSSSTLVGEEQDANSFTKESKKRRFHLHAFRAFRNIFRRRLQRIENDDLQQAAKISRSTTELIEPQVLEKSRFREYESMPTHSKAPYAMGLSVSHDSIFTPDPSTYSIDLNHHSAHFKNELLNKIKLHHISHEEDDDAGLPHSPCTSPTTAEILANNLKDKESKKLSTTCSAGSLLSMGSSENDEDIFGITSASSKPSSSCCGAPNSADDTGVSPLPLSHAAAHHKIAIRPKRNHGKPQHRKYQQNTSSTNLPSTPEVSEFTIIGSPVLNLEHLSTSTQDSMSSEGPQEMADQRQKEESKMSFLKFPSRLKTNCAPKDSHSAEEPFFTRLFGSRRSNRKVKKSHHFESKKEPHPKISSDDVIAHSLPIKKEDVPKPISLLHSKYLEESDNGYPSNLDNTNSKLRQDSVSPVQNVSLNVEKSFGSMLKSQSYNSAKELEDNLAKDLDRDLLHSSSLNNFSNIYSQGSDSEMITDIMKESRTLCDDSPTFAIRYDENNYALNEMDPFSALELSKEKIDSKLNISCDSNDNDIFVNNGLACPLTFETLEKTLKNANNIINDHEATSFSSFITEGNLLTQYCDKKHSDFLKKDLPRSLSFKESKKQNQPQYKRKQTTLPTSMSKEEIEYLFSKDVQKELKKESSADVNIPAKQIRHEDNLQGRADVNIPAKQLKHEDNLQGRANPRQCLLPSPCKKAEKSTTEIKKGSNKNSPFDRPKSLSKPEVKVDHSPHVSKEKKCEANSKNIIESSSKTKFVLQEGFDKPPTRNSLMDSGLNKVESAQAPSNNEKITSETISSSKEKDQSSDTKLSLVKRNQEMFRQLESQGSSSVVNFSKRSSLPTKMTMDKESKAGKKIHKGSSSPCTTPSGINEPELISLFSRRASKHKEEEDKLQLPISNNDSPTSMPIESSSDDQNVELNGASSDLSNKSSNLPKLSSIVPPSSPSKILPFSDPNKQEAISKTKSLISLDMGNVETSQESGAASKAVGDSKGPQSCLRSVSFKCAGNMAQPEGSAQQPAWRQLISQRREQRENLEKLVPNALENVANPKAQRSSKVLAMVNNYQKHLNKET